MVGGTTPISLLQGTPGVNIADAITPTFKKIMPYQIMIAFIGKQTISVGHSCSANLTTHI